MNVGRCKNRPQYICDKCGQIIPYVHKKGFDINKYYKQNKGDYSVKKDFDLCKSCENKLREWLKEKPIPTTENIIDRFPIWEKKLGDD